ncbi:Rdx family-domain-containing protein [Clohesyomyces aquaticus]|uniref:Rdx family-domain-containing protein n=1 Tax=Clohesyomyces aquaticus TaxID=1231657 RepID=A0A1Y2A5W9_9PLEO|nr:Rdx family-domain-containing protein [Clohesyomyces aquaticus]
MSMDFGQELLSTFGTQIGEVALIPATGGLFQVELTYSPPEAAQEGQSLIVKKALLWDRKEKGGFPETKILKQLVRDHIDPNKDLGHSDKHGKKREGKGTQGEPKDESQKKDERQQIKRNPDGTICEDCN